MESITVDPIRVLGIAGSLRKASFNRGLLAAAVELAPAGMSIETFDLAGIPFYDQDLDTDELRPAEVTRFKEAIRDADAVLIATPEYNHSIPGVLKNAIEWASRPPGRSVLADKPVAIMGASTGAVGTARAQSHLVVILRAAGGLVMPHPGVLVANAREKFSADGRLIHQPTRDFLASFLEDLVAWTRRVGDSAGLCML